MDDKVPQLSEITGISQDYINEVAFIPLYCIRNTNPQDNLEFLINRPVKKYTERYAQYEGLITPENRAGVERLDAIAEEINSLCSSDAKSFRVDVLRELICETCELVYGQEETSLKNLQL